MANLLELQTIANGERNLIVKAHLESDGVAGDYTAQLLIDMSLYDITGIAPATSLKLLSVEAAFTGFSAELYWDATANVHLYNIPDFDVDADFSKFDGIVNNAGAGKTGDVLITTAGFAAATDTGHIVMHFIKKYG